MASTLVKLGGEFRVIRMTTDRLGGTPTRSRTSPPSWPTSVQTIQYLGDLSEPSVFNNGATGERAHRAEVLRRLRAGRVAAARPTLTLNYGLRYDYYTPLREARQPRSSSSTSTPA